MSKNVFANGRGISAQKDDNKSLCAMPDVCLSPPSPPAGPVPIPYPNTSKATDTNDGTKTVKIGGGEVGMKNSSTYKKSNGDEAATKSLGMGVVTHTIQGALKHAAWSFDVKIEGANAIRHMDLTTHNHMNCPNIATVLDQENQLLPLDKKLTCKELEQKRDDVERKDLKRFGRGRTLAVADYKAPGGPRMLMKGVSHLKSMVKPNKRAGFAKGRKWPQTKQKSRKLGRRKAKKGPVFKACQETGEYSPSTMQHAEATMVEDVLGAARQAGIAMPPGPVGSMTLSIKWKPSGTRDTLDKPCPSCKGLICQAIECGLDIQICKAGAKEPAPVDCD
jgi:hypothetical protein